MKNLCSVLFILFFFFILSCRNTQSKSNFIINDSYKNDSLIVTQFYKNIIDNNIDWKDYIREESKYMDSLYFIVYESPINGYEIKVRLSHLSESFSGFTGMATLYFIKNNKVANISHPTFYIEDSQFNKLSTHRVDTIRYKLNSFENKINNELGQFKDVPFAFYDIDFDGEKELLLRHPSIGQREINGYTPFKVPDINSYEFEEVRLYESIKRDNDFPILDDFTEFENKNGLIILKSYIGNGEYYLEKYRIAEDVLIKVD